MMLTDGEEDRKRRTEEAVASDRVSMPLADFDYSCGLQLAACIDVQTHWGTSGKLSKKWQ